MERSSQFADELYSDIPRLPTSEMDPKSFIHDAVSNSIDNDEDDIWYDDETSNDGGAEKLQIASDMDREWQRRHDQFHTIGYRDGLMAGKEASAQEGFNIGFKESISVGHRWGLVRGVTSALAGLPDDLKRKMVEAQDTRKELEDLHKSVHALSTIDVLKSFYDGLRGDGQTKALDSQSSDKNIIENHVAKLKMLVSSSSAVNLHLENDL